MPVVEHAWAAGTPPPSSRVAAAAWTRAACRCSSAACRSPSGRRRRVGRDAPRARGALRRPDGRKLATKAPRSPPASRRELRDRPAAARLARALGLDAARHERVGTRAATRSCAPCSCAAAAATTAASTAAAAAPGDGEGEGALLRAYWLLKSSDVPALERAFAGSAPRIAELFGGPAHGAPGPVQGVPLTQMACNVWLASPGLANNLHYDVHWNYLVHGAGPKSVLLAPPADAWRLAIHPRLHPSRRSAHRPAPAVGRDPDVWRSSAREAAARRPVRAGRRAHPAVLAPFISVGPDAPRWASRSSLTAPSPRLRARAPPPRRRPRARARRRDLVPTSRTAIRSRKAAAVVAARALARRFLESACS